MAFKRRLGPAQVRQVLMQALSGRVPIPLSIVRGRLAGLSEKVAIDIEDASPGLRVRGVARALGAPIRFGVRVVADGVFVRGEQRIVQIHLSDVVLSTDDDAPGPLADAIRTGMIDTTNPGTLIGNMVSLPDMVIEAAGQHVTLDLMKAPMIQGDERLRAALTAASSYLGVTGIEIADDALVLRLGLLPGGPKEALLSSARAALTPVVQYLWPEGRP